MTIANPVKMGRLLQARWSHHTANAATRDSVVATVAKLDGSPLDIALVVATICDRMDLGERGDFVAALRAVSDAEQSRRRSEAWGNGS